MGVWILFKTLYIKETMILIQEFSFCGRWVTGERETDNKNKTNK